MIENNSENKGENQRKGPKDRRQTNPDRRNQDRLSEDPDPRRNLEQKDRRKPA